MRWIFRIAFILIVAAALVVGAVLLLPGDRLAGLLSEQIKTQTGRDLTIEGDVRVSLWPVLGIETGPVTLGNADWAGSEPMLSAAGLSVGLDAAALLGGDVKIRQIVADRPVLRLETSEGRGNWLMAPAPGETGGAQGSAVATAGAPEAGEVSLDKLHLTDARLVYVEEGETRFEFSGVDLSASWPSPTAPLAIQAELPAIGGPVQADLEIPDLPGFASGAVADLEISLRAPGGQVSYSGQGNIAGELTGKTRIVAADTARMFAALGQAGVTVPRGLGQAAEITTQMTYTQDGRLSLRKLVAVLDQNRLEGEADIVIADPPHVTARLTTADLDLTQIGGSTSSGGAQGGTAATPSDGWSQTPIDASALSLADGSIRLDAKSIATPGLRLGPSQVTLNLDRARAVLNMNPVTLFSGTLTGRLVANNRKGLSVGGKVKVDGIEMQQALATLGGIERLSGKAAGELEFLGVGATEEQIMRSLSGAGRIDMGRGAISGLNLDTLMGSGDGQGGTTVFNSLSASFDIENGDLNNRDLLMSLDNFRADGAGRIGLGGRDIDYLFTPVALRANAGKGIAIPVRIVGPWANPAIRPDLSKALEAAADVRVEDLEAQAKDKLNQKLSEELDTAVTEDQSVEDLIKDRLEGEARKGLLKLFGAD